MFDEVRVWQFPTRKSTPGSAYELKDDDLDEERTELNLSTSNLCLRAVLPPTCLALIDRCVEQPAKTHDLHQPPCPCPHPISPRAFYRCPLHFPRLISFSLSLLHVCCFISLLFVTFSDFSFTSFMAYEFVLLFFPSLFLFCFFAWHVAFQLACGEVIVYFKGTRGFFFFKATVCGGFKLQENQDLDKDFDGGDLGGRGSWGSSCRRACFKRSLSFEDGRVGAT